MTDAIEDPARLVVDAEAAYNAERRKALALAQRLIEIEHERDHLARVLACILVNQAQLGEVRITASQWYAASQAQHAISEGQNPLTGERIVKVVNVPAQEVQPDRHGEP